MKFEGDPDLIKTFKDKLDFLQQDEPTTVRLTRSNVPGRVDIDGIGYHNTEIIIGPGQNAQEVAGMVEDLTSEILEMNRAETKIDENLQSVLKAMSWRDFQEKMK